METAEQLNFSLVNDPRSGIMRLKLPTHHTTWGEVGKAVGKLGLTLYGKQMVKLPDQMGDESAFFATPIWKRRFVRLARKNRIVPVCDATLRFCPAQVRTGPVGPKSLEPVFPPNISDQNPCATAAGRCFRVDEG